MLRSVKLPCLNAARLGMIAAAMILSQSAALFARPDRVVTGYVPTWRDAVVDPADFNFEAFTHLNRAFLRPQDDGSLIVAENYFNAPFEQAARAHGVKLLMSIGGEAKNPDRWLAIARDPEHVKRLLETLGGLFKEHQYDGVDIDWEPPPRSPEEGQVYLGLLKAVRQRFPDKLLTVALSPKEYAVKYLPLPEVMATIDYFNAMAYDFSGPWTGIASFGSNLNGDPAANTAASVKDVITNLVQKHNVPPAKLVVGTSFWAYRFRVDHLGDAFPKRIKGMADNLEYARVIDLLHTGRYTLHRSESADAPYLVRNDGECVITFDDPQSIRDKTAFAAGLGCAGVMMWNAGADADAGTTPLLNAIAEQAGVPAVHSANALKQETRLLNHNPLSSEDPADVAALNVTLRAARGIAEDDQWIASAPAATQPAATQAAAIQP